MKLNWQSMRPGVWVTVCACLAVAGPAFADDKIAAQELFDAASTLTKQGDYAAACPKFEESQRLDPQIGTLFWLADCQERVHKLASAWSNFVDVAERAASIKKLDHAREAKSRADALKGRLNKLILVVSTETAAAPGLEVRRDDVLVGPAQFGLPVPVDTGTHVIKVSASGKRTWETKVESTGESNTFTVTIPTLNEEPEVRAVGPAASSGSAKSAVFVAAPSGWGGQKIAGALTAGAGAAGLLVGGVLGGLAMGKNGEIDRWCRPDDPTKCSAEGVALSRDVKALGTASTAAFVAGGVLAAGGVVLFLTAPPGSAPAKSGVSVRARVSAGRIAVEGSW